MATTFPTARIENSIFLIRGHKILLDTHLAALYGVTTKRLNEQVRRNRARFPERCRIPPDGRRRGVFEVADYDLKRRPRSLDAFIQ